MSSSARFLVIDTVKGVAVIDLSRLMSVEVISTEDEEKFGPVSKILFKFLLPDSTVHTEVFNIGTHRVRSFLDNLLLMLGGDPDVSDSV